MTPGENGQETGRGGVRTEEHPRSRAPGGSWDRRDWLILLGLLVLTVLAFWRVLFSRDWSFGVELDFLRQFYPARFFASQSLSNGVFPLWNPYMLCGHPFLASYQTAMFYPFNLLMVGLYGAAGADFSLRAQCAFVVFHFFIAGVFTYVLARELKAGRAGSAVAAVVYMFCGYMVAHAGHMNQQSAAAWIPLIFFLFHRSLDRRRLSYAAAAGAFLGIAILAGHLQPVFYLCLLLLAYVVYFALERRMGDGEKPGLPFGLAALAVAVVVGTVLASVQLIPTFELTRLSTRSSLPYGLASAYSLPGRQLIMLLFPHFYGSSPQSYAGSWVMWEMYGYSGIVAGTLGAVALLRRKKGLVVFLWVVLALSLVLALGPGGLLWTALFKSGLLFNRFRDPARMLLIFGFASALLAGLGADHLLRLLPGDTDRGRYRKAVRLVALLFLIVVLIAVAVSLFMALRGGEHGDRAKVAMRSMVVPLVLLGLLALFLLLAPRASAGGKMLGYALVALVAVDLVAMNTPWTMVRVQADDIYSDRAASRYVAARGGTFRVETDANTMYPSLDNGALFGLEKTGGDDSLVLGDYERYRELITPSVSPGVQLGLFREAGLRSPLLDAMNAVYFMSRERIRPALARGKFAYLGARGGIHIYRNTSAMPRAWMTDAVAVEDNERAFELLEKSGGEGLGDTALVVYPGAGGGGDELIRAVKGGIVLRSRSPNRFVIETSPRCRGLLATSEVYYPGWRAYIDGKSAEVLRTNFLFRGVMLEGGQRTVEFRFRPNSLTAGAWISGAALLLLGLYLLFLLWRRRRAGGEKGSAVVPGALEAGGDVKLSVIIPVHNEEATIDRVIERVSSVDLGGVERQIVVVDDGSTDGTVGKLEAYGGRPDMVVIRQEVNRGKGAAIRTALEEATGDLVVIQDADLEYDPGDYPRLMKPILDGEADVVYGSRFRGSIENMAWPNLVANKLLAWAATALFGKRITDEATCYKAFRADVLRSFDLECEGFEFCPEVTAKTVKRGYRLVEIPITYRGRSKTAGKKIRAKDGFKAMWTLVRHRFKP